MKLANLILFVGSFFAAAEGFAQLSKHEQHSLDEFRRILGYEDVYSGIGMPKYHPVDMTFVPPGGSNPIGLDFVGPPQARPDGVYPVTLGKGGPQRKVNKLFHSIVTDHLIEKPAGAHIVIDLRYVPENYLTMTPMRETKSLGNLIPELAQDAGRVSYIMNADGTSVRYAGDGTSGTAITSQPYTPKAPSKPAKLLVADLQSPEKAPGAVAKVSQPNCNPAKPGSTAVKVLGPLAAAIAVREGVQGFQNGVNGHFKRARGIEENIAAIANDLLNPTGSFFRDVGRAHSGNTEVSENSTEELQNPFLLKTSYHINMREELAKMAEEDRIIRARFQYIKQAFQKHHTQVGNLPIFLPKPPQWLLDSMR